MCYSRMTAAVLLAACAAPALAHAGDDEIAPIVELQSGPLTPGLVLDESRQPIHQIRVLVDADLKRGALVLEVNIPEFDEFGALAGGVLTPQVRGERGPLPAVRLECVIEPLKERSDGWRLFRLSGPEIHTPLRLATRGSIGDGGPSRLLVLGPDQKVRSVVECTRYGLVVP